MLAFSLMGCYTELVDGVPIKESIKIEAILIENGILPQSIKSRDGYTIKVKNEDRLKAVSLLSYYELPSGNVPNIQELFPPGELVASPFAEKNRLIFGVSNSLQSTLESIPGVITANVDLAYQTDAETPTVENKNKASVVIVYQSPLVVNANFIEQIKAIIVNANPDINYNNVSVSSFRKQYTPITSDIIGAADNKVKYAYFAVVGLILLMLVFLLLSIGRNQFKSR